MAIFTPSEIAEQMAAYKAALTACASGKSYSISGRTFTRNDLPEIRNTLEWLEGQKNAANSQGGPAYLPGRPRR